MYNYIYNQKQINLAMVRLQFSGPAENTPGLPPLLRPD